MHSIYCSKSTHGGQFLWISWLGGSWYFSGIREVQEIWDHFSRKRFSQKPSIVLWNLSRQRAVQPKSIGLLSSVELLAGTLSGFFWTTITRCVRLFPRRRAWNLIPYCTFKTVRSLKQNLLLKACMNGIIWYRYLWNVKLITAILVYQWHNSSILISVSVKC